ncbi:hypothetical protein J0794_27005 [Bacillus paranthracis]|nr:hypothetical protein [Bacillus paranthracis]
MYDDELEDLLIFILVPTFVGSVVFLIISFIPTIINFYDKNVFYFWTGIFGFISLIAGILYGFYKKEYNRIKTEDCNRIKEEIKQHIRSCYPEETFSLIDEKEFTRKEILKRCFRTYELSVHAFAHHGELVYQVKVNKDEVWLKDFKQVSNVNFVKEFCKK